MYKSFSERSECQNFKSYTDASPTRKAYCCNWSHLMMRIRVLYMRWQNGLRNYLDPVTKDDTVRSYRENPLLNLYLMLDSPNYLCFTVALSQFEYLRWRIQTCKRCQSRKRPRSGVKAIMQLYKQVSPTSAF